MEDAALRDAVQRFHCSVAKQNREHQSLGSLFSNIQSRQIESAKADYWRWILSFWLMKINATVAGMTIMTAPARRL